MRTEYSYNVNPVFKMTSAVLIRGSFDILGDLSIKLGPNSAVMIERETGTLKIYSYQIDIRVANESAYLFNQLSTQLTIALFHRGDNTDTESIAERFIAAPNTSVYGPDARYYNEWPTNYPDYNDLSLVIDNRFDYSVIIDKLEILRSKDTTEIAEDVVDKTLSEGGRLSALNQIDFFPNKVDATYNTGKVVWDLITNTTGILIGLKRQSDGHLVKITYNN